MWEEYCFWVNIESGLVEENIWVLTGIKWDLWACYVPSTTPRYSNPLILCFLFLTPYWNLGPSSSWSLFYPPSKTASKQHCQSHNQAGFGSVPNDSQPKSWWWLWWYLPFIKQKGRDVRSEVLGSFGEQGWNCPSLSMCIKPREISFAPPNSTWSCMSQCM